MDVKISGAPLPKARIVTLATLSDNFIVVASTARDGQKLNMRGLYKFK